ncbi:MULTISPECIES: ThiF family adenylyltransferase [unclassified Rhizobium]|uniref:ThiF family adenylyltransferase n=1 Tax=unclassified Rhizobium TaxID=2613769 RepID=UPI001C82BA0B|nr:MULTISPECIES: ThiF family adenylyltransferase [unclassified Rhizobium]MBX5167030.1 ThiF family adenylyltransferase [Rhizobium sp. NZLR4b]MBX5211177.1 ThiF family adenylyltransferase [Rhizobium sp. NZLR11]
MSQQPIARSPDLQRLRNEGYDILIVAGFLIMKSVPYLTADGKVAWGVLISNLEVANDATVQPQNHTTYLDGEFPHHADGRRIEEIYAGETSLVVSETITGRHYLSAKPQPSLRYSDYFHKMTTYAEILGVGARSVDPSVTAQNFAVVHPDEKDSVFHYQDTASSRAEITEVTRKLRLNKVSIVGLGGTGSYVLDLVAKTPVREIHLFDGDVFLQHNAFRTPGAASGEELERKQSKVSYLQGIYSKMRKGIVPHPENMTDQHLHLLEGMEFVFVCMEGTGKRPIIAKLEAENIPYVDVGMGLYLANGSLGGLVRTTTSTPARRGHVHNLGRIPFAQADEKNEYDKNIQIAELNALNAAFAVIRWKKLFGFYLDQEKEHHSTYSIGGNEVTNEDSEER